LNVLNELRDIELESFPNFFYSTCFFEMGIEKDDLNEEKTISVQLNKNEP